MDYRVALVLVITDYMLYIVKLCYILMTFILVLVHFHLYKM